MEEADLKTQETNNLDLWERHLGLWEPSNFVEE
jgi:hypothetical protein